MTTSEAKEQIRKLDRELKRKLRQDPAYRAAQNERSRVWREANKEYISAYKKEYRERTLETYKKNRKKYGEARRKREVAWDKELTSLVHNEAERLSKMRTEATGIQWSVDHVVPLQGKNVSGLHVWNNIQVIPKAHNQQKYNAYVSDWN